MAGTNGKGSVSAYVAAILKANGKRVGWYNSPHVYAVNERIYVDGSPVPLESMEAAASRIVPFHKAIGYSYFEALTAIAFQIFAENGVELAVLETGLGGRFDATNVVEPVLTLLTGISLDHRRILGDSEEEILREKLGITRPGVPLVCGDADVCNGVETCDANLGCQGGTPLVCGDNDVCNGVELSSGAIRNHRPDVMLRAFELAGYDEDTVKSKFPGDFSCAFQKT